MILGFILVLLQQPAQGAAGRIDVTPARPEVRVGQSLQLRAAVFDAAGKPVPDAKVIWFGARFNGTVDSTGLVRGGFRGHLDIVAMATIPGNQRVTTTTRVAVIAGPPVKIDLRPASVTLPVGGRLTLAGTPLSSDNDTRTDPITYQSANPRVASATPQGLILAVGPGKTVITGTAGSATATVAVQVVPNTIASLTVAPAARTALTGEVVRFSASPKDRSGRAIEGLTPRWLVAAVGSTGSAVIDEEGAFVADEQGV